ncbi:MAG: polysaccharide deacetylase family protein [Chloroflexi bacterium]|nr:polysaccharide deacetylase family protein [Chloroflexota bacterium]
MTKLFLLRYDTERDPAQGMGGFLDKVIQVHRKHAIPATFFCCGGTLDGDRALFAAFGREVAGDPLFDLQDHSHTHIGLGYERGRPLEELRANYERSFAAHRAVFGKAPVGVSICGTGGKDGPRLQGFDQTAKSRAEFEMMASLGLRMINTFLMGEDESRAFVDYGRLGHPEIMGFPSGHGDTSWMYRREHGDPMEYILAAIEERAARDEHMPVMLHDWVAWLHAGDQELTHVVRIADQARRLGYRLVTHLECLQDEALWRR